MADDHEPTVPGDLDAMGDELRKSEKVPQATELVRLAESRYRFAVADDGRTFAVALHGPNLARTLRGTDGLRQELSRAFYELHQRAPSSSALADALVVIEGMAGLASREPLALRVARHGKEVVLDLGTSDGSAIVVSSSGWRIVERSPVVFRRTELTMPLPTPEPGGTLDDLRSMLNVTDESWPLLVGWLTAALIPGMPHPMLLFTGEQGTGKSTTAELVTAVVDPSAAPVQAPPTDVPGWVMTAAGAWVVTLDNLSELKPWLSDALCRAVTGDGLVKRTLYADQALTVVTFRRCIVLTAIDAGALRGDLAERLLTVELERIDPTRRRPDAELRAQFAAAHPRILGAVLDLLVQVLGRLDGIRLAELPRMADFARVLAAVDQATDLDSLATYLTIGDRVAGDVVASDLVASAVVDLLATTDQWQGTAGELLSVLTERQFPDGGRKPKGWPGQAHVLSGQLKRAATVLRQVGVSVDWARENNSKRTRTITLTKTAKPVHNPGCLAVGRDTAAPAPSPDHPPGIRSDGPVGRASEASGASDALADLGVLPDAPTDAVDARRCDEAQEASYLHTTADQATTSQADAVDALDALAPAASERSAVCDECCSLRAFWDGDEPQCLAAGPCYYREPAA